MSSQFNYPLDHLRELAENVLHIAKTRGATECAVEVSEGGGMSVNVRRGKVETIEQNQDKGVGLTCYLGKKKGHASTSDFSLKALEDTVQAALDIARFTSPDEFSGLPEDEFFEREPMDLKLYKPWNITADEAIEFARRAEDAAFAVDPAIRNSDGASVSVQHAQFISANSRGFMGGYPHSRHYLTVAPIARVRREMERDDWYTASRDPKKLAAPEAVGEYAARRALSRLGARKISTRKCPVLFEAPLAGGLLGSFVQAISGGALYRRTTFLADSLGTQVFPSHVSLTEDPHIKGAMGSAPFDEEGVRTRQRDVVRDGIVQGYFLSTYSARKLGMRTTGNAGGSHNLVLSSALTKRGDDFERMLKKLGTGLLVTDLMGQGINYVTGDYSRGAAGHWVENGKIVYPVGEITIAGNLRQMFENIVAIGADRISRGTKTTGSILIGEMMIAGS
ncbi:metalloprotease PmbA [Derxia gummosa]|uniref:Metalloprotease PmbA n=1 Tax=Derxia gummosa DSM 723 TaxID=1121388 RepID=A0A8B6X118_9BURK|nr:metalloprotease PmbA [Derxia gummosa]